MATKKIPIDNDIVINLIDMLLGLRSYVKEDKELHDGVETVARVLLLTVIAEKGEVSLEDCKRWEKMGLLKNISIH